MFGLVRPYYKKMIKQDKCRYHCYYCGLCMGIGRSTGYISRCLINYDICLTYIVADSVNVDDEIKTGRCPFPPFKKVSYRDNPALLGKMAGINYILTYHNVLDDIDDDNSLVAKVIERVMRKKYLEVKKENEQAVQVVVDGLKAINSMEDKNAAISVRDAALPFGELLGNVMQGCLEDEADNKVFSALCKHLGMWIYIIDACVDLKKDIKHKKYNPLKAGREGASAQEIMAARKTEITDFLMNCKNSMQQLLELLACGKNAALVHDLFEYILPLEVAEMLK